MSYFYQTLTPVVAQPTSTWRQDVTLGKPLLVGPSNGSNLCDSGATFVSGSGSGIIVKWLAVSGATDYILQWCNNSSFSGPTLYSERTVLLQKEMSFIDDIRLGEEIHWRVMAFDTAGGVSEKSEAWSFKYECPDNEGDSENQNKKTNPETGNKQDGTLCARLDVKVQLKGPQNLMCCDKAMWHLKYSYSCADSAGNAVTVSAIEYKLVQAKDNSNTIIDAEPEYVVVESKGTKDSQEFKIQAIVTFSVDGSSFECTDEIQVTTDCIAGFPYEKPWLHLTYGPHYGVLHYMHPYYAHQDAIGSSECMNPYRWSDGYPQTHVSEPYGTGGTIIAVGPVVEVQRFYKDFTNPVQYCDYGISLGYAIETVLQARIPIGLECGLYAMSTGLIGVDLYQLFTGYHGLHVGQGNHGPIVEQDDEQCTVGVHTGCNLNIHGVNPYDGDFRNGSVYADTSLIAGAGLGYSADNCKLYVVFQDLSGCGLYYNGASSTNNVQASDIAGYGLTSRDSSDPEGSECVLDINNGDGLRIADDGTLEVATGCGLQIVDAEVAVNVDDLVGFGLLASAEDGCAINAIPNILVYGMCGIYTEGGGPGIPLGIGWNRDQVIGDGLKASAGSPALGDCAFELDLGCGLEFFSSGNGPTGSGVQLNMTGLVGLGLVEWENGDGCIGVQADIGCGLEFNGNQIKIKPVDIAGAGIEGDLFQPGECFIQIDFPANCGLAFGVDDNLDKLIVDMTEMVGKGLVSWENDYGCVGVQADIGCGLEFGDDDEITIDTSAIAGAGLEGDLVQEPGECVIQIDFPVNCGLAFGTGGNLDKLIVDMTEMVGAGIRTWENAYGCVGVQADIGDGLKFSGAGESSVIEVDCTWIEDHCDVQGSQGSQGPQGYQGPQGVQGSEGGQGPQGVQGPEGPEGSQGSQGYQGSEGPQGAQGPAGSQGPQGSQGPEGPEGPQGSEGAQGPRGYQGYQGPKGPQGYQGYQGPKGSQGPQGYQGYQGPRGYQGYQGYQGPKGPQGAQGPAGSQGPQGYQGSEGSQGPQGYQGPQGSQGPQGYQGSQGSQGSEGPQGSQGPEGPQGSEGSEGAQGPAGPQGSEGSQGSTGSQGPQGYQGSAGSQGPQGYQGSQGYQGPRGYQGYQGYQGPEGPQGYQGYQGPAGGPQGPQGYQGPEGPQGYQGYQGTEGPQGYQGYQGPAGGPQGPQGPAGPAGGPPGPRGFQGHQGPEGPNGPPGDIGPLGPTGPTGDKLAIVPFENEFVGMVCVESPEVRFEDVLEIKTSEHTVLDHGISVQIRVPIDQVFLSVCVEGTIRAIGCTTSEPALVAAVVTGSEVVLTIRGDTPSVIVTKISGIRLGRDNIRFTRYNREQMDNNNAFWGLAQTNVSKLLHTDTQS